MKYFVLNPGFIVKIDGPSLVISNRKLCCHDHSCKNKCQDCYGANKPLRSQLTQLSPFNPINILRTLAINSNQIVLSFGVLIVFLFQKQSEIEESSLESMAKKMESSETWRTKALKSFAISKSGMQGGEAKRNLTWSILDDSYFSHFWSTSWSSIYACYMSFRSSGSQQSNASNGAWFGVEMKEL